MDHKYKELLEELKKQYESENVSLLVGAGFSKNALHSFPTWNELLFDMVEELYRDEIYNNAKRLIHKSPIKTIINKDFKKNKIQQIINNVGYLELVSNFLKKRGMREAVEIYIEERTPFIDKENHKFILPKGENINIENEDLSLHEKVLEGKWEQIYTTNYDNLLEYTAKRKSKGWKEIVSGSGLSFSNTKKNIIKIHGSLRSIQERSNNESFYFDDCHDHCYIITKEDYDSYAVKHEAFAQLMRISLLKGVFCLLGFSGNDQNFLSWVKWVKDILLKSNNRGTTHKVFLVTIDEKEVDKETNLYYKNHHICIIPLRNQQVKETINSKSNNPKELIHAFLEYLYKSNIKIKDSYSNHWKYIIRNQEAIPDEELLSISTSIGFKKETIFQEYFLNGMGFNRNEPKISELQLALLAIFDTGDSLEEHTGLIDIIESNIPKFSRDYQLLYNDIKNRNITINKNLSKKLNESPNINDYDKALRLAFNLEFIKLKKFLDQWNPSDSKLINKASLMSVFDKKLAKSLLSNYIDKDQTNTKEKFLAIQTVNLFTDFNEERISTIDFENQNLESIRSIKKYLIGEILQKEDTIKPYGYSTSNNISNEKYSEAFRLFNYLINIGPQLTSETSQYISASDWYVIFKNLYNYYPFPCFYFSLQFDTRDTLSRIGQDFAYSNHLRNETKLILKKSLKNLIDNTIPNDYIISTFTICSEFLSSVTSSEWEQDFMEIWDKYLLPKFEEEERYDSIFTFIKKGLPFIEIEQNKLKIITDCLLKSYNNPDNSILFLYYLKVNNLNISKEVDFIKLLNEYCLEIKKTSQINVVGNIMRVLDANHIKTIAEKILLFIENDDIIEKNTMYTCCFFLKKAEIKMTKLKQYIIKSDKVWDNGIRQDRNSITQPDFWELSHFEQFFEWNQNELVKLYKDLIIKLDQLLESSHYQNKEMLFFRRYYIKLLDEMLNFLVKNESLLSIQKTFYPIKHKITAELQDKRGYTNLSEGLLSRDSSTVISALNLFFRSINESGISEFEYEFSLIISRFLNQRRESLESCIECINYTIKKYYTVNELPNDLKKSIIHALDAYTIELLVKLELDVPRISKYLMNISEYLSNLHQDSTGIDYWLAQKKAKRFN
ncbi:SIR2 family protein [Elizabethkingia anophelis]|uniref:SIR2 family protein n=1 Tax=Elizabethkingia anophelis TaxID=1117645 RepID=UPI003891A278